MSEYKKERKETIKATVKVIVDTRAYVGISYFMYKRGLFSCLVLYVIMLRMVKKEKKKKWRQKKKKECENL